MESEDDFTSGVFKEIFESKTVDVARKGVDYIDKDGNLKTKVNIEQQEVYEKFNILIPYISESIQNILTSYDGKFKEEKDDLNEEPVTDETRAMLSNIDKFDRSSFEFSKLDSVSKKVKLFFSTIMYHEKDPDYDRSYYEKQSEKDKAKNPLFLDEEGNAPFTIATKSRFIVPKFMPINEVFNIIVNDLGHVDSV